MYPYPNAGRHTIAGESFELMDGIFGMALEKAKQKTRHLFFHALASEHENSVPNSALVNRTAWATDENAFADSFRVLGSRGTQSAASAIDTNGNLFFGLNSMNAIACWATKKPLTQIAVKTLVKDDERLQFAGGMKVIRNTDGEEELWLVTNRFQVRKLFSLRFGFCTQISFPASVLIRGENSSCCLPARTNSN
jgi:Major royal jelly protein